MNWACVSKQEGRRRKKGRKRTNAACYCVPFWAFAQLAGCCCSCLNHLFYKEPQKVKVLEAWSVDASGDVDHPFMPSSSGSSMCHQHIGKGGRGSRVTLPRGDPSQTKVHHELFLAQGSVSVGWRKFWHGYVTTIYQVHLVIQGKGYC